MKDKNNLKNLYLFRWDEMPEFDIYSDQLLSIVNEELDNFSYFDDNLKVTKSMINNYVKHDLMPKPFKKKYSKIHISYILMITFFKNIISLDETKNLMDFLTSNNEISVIYDLFANILESTIINTFRDEDTNINYKNNDLIPLQKICLAISCKYYTKDYLRIVEELKNKDN